jgi:predicted MPP superfamily phosphohydrolase
MHKIDKLTVIERILSKDRRRRIYHNTIPEIYKNDKEIINAERKAGKRIVDRKGYDVIRQIYFVRENVLDYNPYSKEEVWKVETTEFGDFDSYYSYLDGEIYENASYFQCDLTSISRDIDLKRVTMNQSFINETIDDFTLAVSDDEISAFQKGEERKQQYKEWIDKCRRVKTWEELEEVYSAFQGTQLFTYLMSDGFNEYHYDYAYKFFILWFSVFDAEGDETKFALLMEFISKTYIGRDLLPFVTAIFGPKVVMDHYNPVELFSKGWDAVKTKRLKKLISALDKGQMVVSKKAFYDSITHYYCERTLYQWVSNGIGKSMYTYRFFETFEEFVRYRQGDLTETDLSCAIDLSCDYSKYKVDSTTKLPVNTRINYRYALTKKYVDGKYVVRQAWYDENNIEVKQVTHKFDYFFDFITFLKGDLSEANLLACDGLINLRDTSGLNFEGAILTSPVCEKLGIQYRDYEINTDAIDSFSISEINEEETQIELQSERKIVPTRKNEWDYLDSNYRVSYVSDLHLMHKLQRLMPKSRADVAYYVEKIAGRIADECAEILLIGGDVASDFAIFELFVWVLHDEIGRRRKNTTVIFVLGNHELWSFSQKPVGEIVKRYEKLLAENGMYLIQNSLLYMDARRLWHGIKTDELISMGTQQLRDVLREASIVFFGGMGFSGYNQEFNAKNGIYRDVLGEDQEQEESRSFEELYDKVLSTVPNREIIVFTHMPMDCWRKQVDYHQGYIYVSGHTHRNYFNDDGEVRIYADNQIGYGKNEIHLKWFDVDADYDYFYDYEDGIYQITGDQYQSFYFGKNIRCNFNRDVNILYMLKKNGYYCFIHQSKNGTLTILNGGSLKKIDKHPIQYYYDNMDRMVAMIKSPLDKYTKFQEKIASEVRKLGGDGRIHGCIIDIDWYNHIYVNPIDMKITGYWAADIVHKKVYPSIPALLEAQRPAMYAKYQKQIQGKSKGIVALAKEAESNVAVLPRTYLDTDMYVASREIKKMQKLSSNILTTWYDVKQESKRTSTKSIPQKHE